MNGYSHHGRNIFLTALGTYAVYEAVNSDDDCDVDDIMEGDSDCQEVALTDDEVEAAGLDPVKDDDSDGEMTALDVMIVILLSIFLTIVIVVIIVTLLETSERKANKEKRRRRF
jgi:hypothetical protein